MTWFGARVRNIFNEGELSAFGLPGVTGVLVLDVPAQSALAKDGLKKNDVILSINGGKTTDAASLTSQTSRIGRPCALETGISRDQRERRHSTNACGTFTPSATLTMRPPRSLAPCVKGWCRTRPPWQGGRAGSRTLVIAGLERWRLVSGANPSPRNL